MRGTVAGVDAYGPATAAVEQFLARCTRLTRTEEDALQCAAAHTWGRGPTRHRLSARDHAWYRLHETVAAQQVDEQFRALWLRLADQPGGSNRMQGLGLSDAACALMLTPWRDAGPFRAADADTLLAVWRSAIEDDPGSSLALMLMPTYPCTPEELWQVVAATELPPVRTGPRSEAEPLTAAEPLSGARPPRTGLPAAALTGHAVTGR